MKFALFAKIAVMALFCVLAGGVLSYRAEPGWLVPVLLLASWLAYRLARPYQELARQCTEPATGAMDEAQRIHLAWQRLRQDLDEALRQQVLAQEATLQQARHNEQSRAACLAQLSRDLQLPLQQGLGMLALLQTTSLTARQQGYLQFALSSGQALRIRITNLQDLSQLALGRFELDEVDFDVRELVDGITSDFAPLAHAKGLELTSFLPAAMTTAMHGDPNRLRQIFSSLLDQAIHLSQVGGSVEIHGGPVDKGHHGTVELMFEVRVSDLDLAVDDREQLNVFFNQEHAQSNPCHAALGPGLFFAHQLVAMMGGHLAMDDNPYHPAGSILYFNIFLKQQGSSLSQPAPEIPKDLRILVVGSSGLQLTMLENALAGWGTGLSHVAEPQSARDILEQAEQRGPPYPLVIVNQKAGQDGTEALAMLELACPHACYLLLSDRLDQALDQAAGLPGAAICLQKPFSIDRLYSALNRLLAARPAKTSPPQPDSVAAPGGPIPLPEADILLVDDQPTNLKLAQLMLTRLGCDANRVIGVASGEEAIQLFRHKAFHLVFMDCQMPVRDGYETTRQLRELEQTLARPRTPIIALTADATEDGRRACREAGMDDYQSKPINMGELHGKLKHHLNRAPSPANSDGPTSSPQPEVNLDAILESIGLPEEAYVEVAELILSQIPDLMESLEEDLRQGAYDASRAKSHVLKGSMANTLFPTLKSQTQRLHQAIRDGRWEEAIHGMMTMRSDFLPIHQALTAYVRRARGA